MLCPNLMLLQQTFLRFVLDPRSQFYRHGVLSKSKHATLQSAVNILGYDSNKMRPIKQNFINISKCSWAISCIKIWMKNNVLEPTMSPSSGSI